MEERFFRRKAYDELKAWKETQASRHALLLEGARRIGKSFLLMEFARREYESFIYIDFSLKSRSVTLARKAFLEAEDVADLISQLEIIFKVRLVDGRSCLIMDEVQRFPAAREMVKSLVRYGKYHYVESGSLVGIRENTRDILIPSEEHKVKMHPLDFGEFLDAIGETPLAEALVRAHSEGRAVAPAVHEKAVYLFRVYMIVGGMPQSVAAYLADPGHWLETCESVKREILSLYDSDMGKYAKGYAAKVRAVFNEIPSALSRHEKKFHLSDVDVNARMRRYEMAFLWLSEAMVVNVAYNSTDPDVGIGMNLDYTTFKCYALDTGLLLTLAMRETRDADARLLRGLLYDTLGINEGMFCENVVAQTLAAKGHSLFFYSRRDPKNAEGTMEVDFILRNGIKVSPLEVKSGRCRPHASLDKFCSKFSARIGTRYVVSPNAYERSNGVVYLPLYMLHLC